MDLYTAIDAPRVHHQLMPNIAIFEDGYGTEMLNELSKRGHNASIFGTLAAWAISLWLLAIIDTATSSAGFSRAGSQKVARQNSSCCQ